MDVPLRETVYRPFLSARYLKSRLVNLIAVGGVMFGVAVLIGVTSVMDGFRAQVLAVLRGNLSDIVMTPLIPEGESLPSYEAMDREIRRDARVAATSPQVSRVVFYLYPAYGVRQFVVDGHAIEQMTVVGIDFDRERHVSDIAKYIMAANDPDRPFESDRAVDRERAGTVLVSRTFAEKFRDLGRPDGPFPTPKDLLETDVGITFVDLSTQAPGAGGESPPQEGGGGPGQARVSAGWRTHQLVISGVYDAQDTSMDATRLYMDIDKLRRVARIDDPYHLIRVKLKDPATAPAVKHDFTQRFPDFQTTTWKDHRRQYLRAVNNEKVLLVIVLSFIVLLGGFTILATLTLTVVEKTRDIGVLAALGATRRGILTLFVGTGLLIGIVGSVLGVGLGWLFVSNVNEIKDFLADRMGIQIFPADIYLFREIPTIWDWSTVAWVVGGSIAMAFLAGLVPALRAARMDPVRALRYE